MSMSSARIARARCRPLFLALVVAGCGRDHAVAWRHTPARASGRRVAHTRTSHTISFDKYSLIIDGRRTYIWSGEFHPFRLPSPSLWRDVLEKMKAEGYNAVSMYFDWGYHSPKQGVYDFTGVRDMDEVLDIAQQVGLYVIARPGPYINGELDAGGFPGWLLTQAGRARTDAPDYLAAADEWLTHIDAIIARHQFTNGTGPVILYQIENELGSAGSSQVNYMNHLAAKARADGITVPIFHNDKGRNGLWVPASSNVPGTVPGPTDLYAFDGYPGGTCHTDGTPGSPNAAPDWGIWGPGGAKGGASASPNTPGFAAEFGGGWFDYWGSVGTYDCMAQREGPGYERVFYETNIANRLTLENFYMTFGGTSWGWLPAPVVYTSYDYGAAISESRQLRPKATTMKEIGLFLQSTPEIAKVDPGPVGDPELACGQGLRRRESRHRDALLHRDAQPVECHDRRHFHVPDLDSRRQLHDSAVGHAAAERPGLEDPPRRLSARPPAPRVLDLGADDALQPGRQDLALLHGRDGEDGETVLRYHARPHVDVLAGTVSSTYDPATGDLRLDYVHNGLTEVRIQSRDLPPMLLLIADDSTAGTFWRQDTAAGPVLERGPELVRTAVRPRPDAVAHRRHVAAERPRGVGAQAGRPVAWDGRAVWTHRTDSGSSQRPDPASRPGAVHASGSDAVRVALLTRIA